MADKDRLEPGEGGRLETGFESHYKQTRTGSTYKYSLRTRPSPSLGSLPDSYFKTYVVEKFRIFRKHARLQNAKEFLKTTTPFMPRYAHSFDPESNS